MGYRPGGFLPDGSDAPRSLPRRASLRARDASPEVQLLVALNSGVQVRVIFGVRKLLCEWPTICEARRA